MKKVIKYIYNRIRFRKKGRFKFSSNIGKESSLEGSNFIGDNTTLYGSLGFGSYIGYNSFIVGKIGRFCSIGSCVRVIRGMHPSKVFISTHPYFYSKEGVNGVSYVKKQKFNEFKYADNESCILIKNDVWIGDNVSIIEGVTVENGAIIAAGSLVNKDVDPYTIVGGVPAKVIGYRFEKEIIKELDNSKWWDKDIEWIKQNAEMFENFKQFSSLFKK